MNLHFENSIPFSIHIHLTFPIQFLDWCCKANWRSIRVGENCFCIDKWEGKAPWSCPEEIYSIKTPTKMENEPFTKWSLQRVLIGHVFETNEASPASKLRRVEYQNYGLWTLSFMQTSFELESKFIQWTS